MKTEEAIKIFLEAKVGVRNPKTIRWYRGNLSVFSTFIGADKQIEKITIQELRKWRAELTQRDITVWSVHAYLRSVKHFLKWLNDEEVLASNPAKRLELPRLPRTPRQGISDEDRDAMLFAIRGNLRDYAMLLFVATTGSREGGVATLTISNLDLADMQAVVIEKGEKSRTVFFGEKTAIALQQWLNVRPITKEDEVFVQKTGCPLTTAGIYQIFKCAARDAGVEKNWSPHQWRHAFARNFLRNGGDIGVLSQILGHSSIHVTLLHYGSLVNKDLQRAHSKYAPKVT